MLFCFSLSADFDKMKEAHDRAKQFEQSFQNFNFSTAGHSQAGQRNRPDEWKRSSECLPSTSSFVLPVATDMEKQSYFPAPPTGNGDFFLVSLKNFSSCFCHA